VNYLVGGGQQRLRGGEAEGFGVLEVDDELEPRPPLVGRPTGTGDRQVKCGPGGIGKTLPEKCRKLAV
jgi:hypothetical protein